MPVRTRINDSDLDTGNYLLTVITKDNKVQHSKFVNE